LVAQRSARCRSRPWRGLCGSRTICQHRPLANQARNGPKRMKNFSAPLPLWARVVLLTGLVGIALGAGLVAYRYYSKPVTLSLAVGSFDGEASKVASIIAGRLDAAKSPVRVTVVPTDSVLDSAKMFAAGKVDLAIVRADVGDLSQARSVVLVNKSVLMILAPGTALTSIEKLRGHTVGVVGGEINQRIVDALKKEYDLGDKVTFRNIAPADTPRAIQSKEASAFLVVVPLNEKYLSRVRLFFRGSHGRRGARASVIIRCGERPPAMRWPPSTGSRAAYP